MKKEEEEEEYAFGTVVVLKESFGFLRLTHDYYDDDSDDEVVEEGKPSTSSRDDEEDDDGDEDDDETTTKSARVMATLRAQAQLFFHITEYFKNPELEKELLEEGAEEEEFDRPLMPGDVVKFKVTRGSSGGKGGGQKREKEGKTHKAMDVMRCSREDLRIKIVREKVEGIVKRGLKGKTKQEAIGGCVSCSLLGDEEEKLELEFSGANVLESCKKKLKQGMKVSFSIGREPTTKKYVVVDIAPIVEEKITKKKENTAKSLSNTIASPYLVRLQITQSRRYDFWSIFNLKTIRSSTSIANGLGAGCMRQMP